MPQMLLLALHIEQCRNVFKSDVIIIKMQFEKATGRMKPIPQTAQSCC